MLRLIRLRPGASHVEAFSCSICMPRRLSRKALQDYAVREILTEGTGDPEVLLLRNGCSAAASWRNSSSQMKQQRCNGSPEPTCSSSQGGSEFGVLAALLARDSTIVTFASCDKQKCFTHDLGLRYKGSFGPAGRPITLADRLQAQFKLQNMTSCQHNGSGLDP